MCASMQAPVNSSSILHHSRIPWIKFHLSIDKTAEHMKICCDVAGVPILDEQGACRKGGVLQILSPCRCSSTLCLQTVIRFLLPSQWLGVPIQGLEGMAPLHHCQQSVPLSLHTCTHGPAVFLPAAPSNNGYEHLQCFQSRISHWDISPVMMNLQTSVGFSSAGVEPNPSSAAHLQVECFS